ncbi:MAG: MYXO-CTERM sorting domain-containing protein [Phycisphaerales bacterium]
MGESTDIYTSIAISTATVPTPGALALLGLGGLVAGRRRR